MAELAPTSRWSAAQTRSQFAAIAWLRWRILINSFRRKGGAGELVGNIFLYILFTSVTVFFVAGAGFTAYYFAGNGQLAHTSWLLWGIFVLCQLLNIQLGQPGTTFDPTQLIRFPLRVDTYISIRLFFGLLTPANIVGTLMSFAVAVGIAIAIPSLTLCAFLALSVFAATNVLFSRMVFAWVDRWLSTRRAREVFTALVFAVSLGIQWANFNFNPAYNHHRLRGISPQHLRVAAGIYHHLRPMLAGLPPELTDTAILSIHRGATSGFFVYTLACALFAVLFFAVFALRMRTEYRGESLSDAANAVSHKTIKPTAATIPPIPSVAVPSATTSTLGLPPVILTMLGKEFLYVRRHTGVIYGLIMPIFLVLVFAGRAASHSNSVWIFPAAVAYTLLTIAPLSYNYFGLEGAGSQFYFLAPVRLRDVLLAKNLFGFLMTLVEVLTIFGIITYISGIPPLQTTAAALLWAVGTLAINNILGNRRSFTTPKKINPQRMANKQTSQVSAFISLGILTLSYSLAAGVFFLCIWLHQKWALVPISLLFAVAGTALYIQSLRSIDQFARDHREELFAELCKQN